MFRKLLIGVVAAFTLGVTSIGIGGGTASAEVVKNEWWPAALNRDNPCELGTVEIKLSGLQHQLWYTTPEGTLKMNLQAHLTGVDADGTEYVANVQRHMEHQLPFPPGVPFTDKFTTNLISKGSTVNAQIVVVYDYPNGSPPIATFTACRG
jgi:hypothetical protein